MRSAEELKKAAADIRLEDQQVGAAVIRSILNERDIESIRRWSRVAVAGAFAVTLAAAITAMCPRYTWQQLPSDAENGYVLKIDKWTGEARVCVLRSLSSAPSNPPAFPADCGRW